MKPDQSFGHRQLIEQAVDPLPDAGGLFIRLDVDVGGPVAHGMDDQRIDEGRHRDLVHHVRQILGGESRPAGHLAIRLEVEQPLNRLRSNPIEALDPDPDLLFTRRHRLDLAAKHELQLVPALRVRRISHRQVQAVTLDPKGQDQVMEGEPGRHLRQRLRLHQHILES